MEKPDQRRDAREPYEKPEVRKVDLVAGEVAAAGCKTKTSLMGPTTGCLKSACMRIGS